MIFLHPDFIYYMMPLLIVFFALIITQADKNIAVFAPEILRRLRVHHKHLSMRTRNVLYFVVFVLLILSLAQPVIPHGKIDVGEKNANIVLAIDTAESMLAQDIAPNRLDMAKYKMLGLLKLLNANKIGCIAFAKHSFLVSPLSFDHRAVRFLIRHFDPSSTVEPGVNFGQLLYSTNRMSKNSKKYLVIFTDGGHQNSFKDEIAYAKKHHIVVFVLAIGSNKGAPIPTGNGFLTYHGHIVISRLNSNISSLAVDTGGVYIHYVLSDADIMHLAQEIKNTIKQNSMKLQSVSDNQPLFYIPLILALMLLVVAMSSVPNTKKTAQAASALFVVLLFHTTAAHADILSFETLNAAKQAYQNHQYAKSAQLFKEYQRIHDTSDVSYDYANALYKNKEYKQAIAQYRRAKFKNKLKQADLLYNMANAYAKEGSVPSLKKALQLYNQALKLKKSNDAIYNKKVVEQLLKQKQHKKHNQNKKQNKKQSQSNKQQKNSQSHNQNQSQNQNKKQNNRQNKKQQKNSSKNHSTKNSNGQKQQRKQQRPLKSKSGKKHSKQQKQPEQNSPNNQQNKKRQSRSQQFKQHPRQLAKQRVRPSGAKPGAAKKEKPNQIKAKRQAGFVNKNKMSKKEIKEWLKQIQFNAPTHVYEMKQMPKNMEDYNAKPW